MFADPELSDELMEKIVAFVDREAGRDAPLTATDEAMVRDLLKHDPAAQSLADELRATNAGLDTFLDDVKSVDVPDSLIALIQGHGSSDVLIAGQPGEAAGSHGDGVAAEVAGLRRPIDTGFGYGAFAAAASIALFVSCGALLHLYTTHQADRRGLEAALAAASEASAERDRALASTSAEVQRLTALAERSVDENDQAVRQLTEREDALQLLAIEQTVLQDQYEELLGENERLSALATERLSDVAGVRSEREQIVADLSSIREALEAERLDKGKVRGILPSETSELTDDLADRQQRLVELTETLEATLQRTNESDRLVGGQQSLESRFKAHDGEKDQLRAERDLAEKSAEDAEQQIDMLRAGLAIAERIRQETIASLQADLDASKNWLGQIAQYHRIYASTSRRHLVEVGADEQDHIEQWLAKMLKRPVPVPDLSRFGVTFAGARLLGVNEKPVAQLVYLDADDRPLALCITPSTREVKAPTTSENRGLNLIDWRDGQHGYAVVGWSDATLLESLADAILPSYEL